MRKGINNGVLINGANSMKTYAVARLPYSTYVHSGLKGKVIAIIGGEIFFLKEVKYDLVVPSTDATGKTITNSGVTCNEDLSLAFNGSAYLESPSVADFNIATNDFTFQGKFKINTLSFNTYSALFEIVDYTNILVRYQWEGASKFFIVYVAGTSKNIPYAWVAGDEHIIAFTRTSGVCRFFIDGVKIDEWTNATSVGQGALRLGVQDTGSYKLNGTIRDFEFANGFSRFTASYTPAGIVQDSYTKFLLSGCVSTYTDTDIYTTDIKNLSSGTLTNVNTDKNALALNYVSGTWDCTYDGSVLPASASPAWTKTGIGTESVTSGVLKLSGTSSSLAYGRSSVVTALNTTVLEAKTRIVSINDTTLGQLFAIRDGSKTVMLKTFATKIEMDSGNGGSFYSCDMTKFNVIRITKVGSTSWSVSLNGEVVLSGTSFGSTTSNSIDISYTDQLKEIYIDYLTYKLNGEPTYATTGNRISQGIDLSSVGVCNTSKVEWESVNPTNASTTIELSTNNGVDYQAVTNGGTIPQLPAGTSTVGKILKVKETLTGNGSVTPLLKNLKVKINVPV